MSTTAAQMIEDKGGSAVFASLTGKTTGAVRVWKHRNYFPREAWPEIIKAFPDITLDRLMAIEATKSPAPSTTEALAQ